MDEINLNIDELEPSSLNISEGAPSQSSFGIEMLMNTKKVSSGSKGGSSFDLGDLDTLENELNNLSEATSGASAASAATPKNSDSKIMSGISNLFGFGLNDRMRKMLPSEFTYVTFRHSIIKKSVAYDEHGNTYVTNRTEVMTDLFNAIKDHYISDDKKLSIANEKFIRLMCEKDVI